MTVFIRSCGASQRLCPAVWEELVQKQVCKHLLPLRSEIAILVQPDVEQRGYVVLPVTLVSLRSRRASPTGRDVLCVGLNWMFSNLSVYIIITYLKEVKHALKCVSDRKILLHT
jgi:hypothetical protein